MLDFSLTLPFTKTMVLFRVVAFLLGVLCWVGPMHPPCIVWVTEDLACLAMEELLLWKKQRVLFLRSCKLFFLKYVPVSSGKVCNVGHSFISPNPSSDKNTITNFAYTVELGGMNVGYTGCLGSVSKVRREGA